MSDILELIKARRSAKKYTDKKVSDELLEKIAEAGTYAANGRGVQSPVIVVVKDKALRDKLSRINGSIMGIDKDPFYGAPYVIVVLADSTVFTYIEDGSLVLGNMMLEATSLGVDSCWIHRARQTFETEEGKAILKEWGLDEKYKGIGNLIIGYRDGDFKERAPRKKDYIIYK